MSGIPGSHARCYRGIELLLERGIPLKLKTMVMTLNQHEFADMQAYAHGLGLDFRYDPLMNAGVDGCNMPTTYRLDPQQVVQIDSIMPNAMQSFTS